jgi:hypothetical protein
LDFQHKVLITIDFVAEDVTETLNIRRDDLIAVIRYPEEDDPLMNPTAVCYADDGAQTRFIQYDPDTLEIQEDNWIPYSPEFLLTIFQTGEIEAAEITPSTGVEIVSGEEADVE